ncbi:MAG: chorismate--pyruvate lyase [Lachnospiraceae bacterium]|nr:chorismate--pyruvate lyase [Lachnospiraceae bacterium]
MFEACEYKVIQIDGDYADVVKAGDEAAEPKVVARALLPADIYEGCTLKYEMLQYTLVN